MSKIALSPSPTGSAVYTIASPAGSTDRVLTLPDETATLFTNAGGTLTGGLTMGGQLNLGSTGQIVFPATQNASANANTLDDYEEGTWTPSLNFTGNSVAMTFSGQVGRYTKIGNMVYLTATMALSNKGTSSGDARIGSLPFTIATVSGLFPCAAINAFVLDTTRQIVVQVSNNVPATGVELKLAGTDTNLTNAEVTNTSSFRFMFFYQAA